VSSYYKITVNVPLENSDDVRKAMGEAGTGKIGNYSYCSFSVAGTGRSMPNSNANPHIGKADQVAEVREEKIETFCLKEDLEKVISAIKKSHPYEEPAITYWEVNIV